MASKVSKSTFLIGVTAATLCTAHTYLTPMLDKHEGDKKIAYLDSARIWTACRGIGYVQPHAVFTDAECKALDNTAEGQFLGKVGALVIRQTPPLTLASYTDLAYNIGMFGFSHSTVLKRNNEGDLPDSCEAILFFKGAGAVEDCSKTKGWTKEQGGCYGRWTRLLEDRNNCLEGLKNVPIVH